ncbi:MAG: dehydratase [Chloroflexi bacterium]|nr:dehydratase [Chloroflexota bacterium]
MATTHLFYEDVVEGAELPPKAKGPLTVTDLVKFAGASGDYAKIHHDREYAKKEGGLPDIILHGQAKLAFLGHLVTDWIGPSGFVKKLGASYRGMDEVGVTITARGKVVRKYVEGRQGLVDLELWLENSKGEKSAVGSATVMVPLRRRRR